MCYSFVVLTDHPLPNDVEALKALVLTSQREVQARDTRLAVQQERIIALEKLVSDLRRAQFGASSEKVDPDQLNLTFEDIEVAIEVVQSQADSDEADASAKTRKPKRKVNRGHLPKHFERVEVILEPEEGTTCSCGHPCHVIGEDVSERLEIIPAQFRVIVTKRPKYGCRGCDAGILQAPAPKHIVAGGIPTQTTLAHVIVSKYADHLPLYRQAQIYSRQGLDLDRSTLASWVGKASVHLKPIYEQLLHELKQSTKLFMDETPAPVLAPGRRKVHKGYFWALARDDRAWSGGDPPGVAFTYAPGRSGDYAEQILHDFDGILQVDGYQGYDRLQVREDRPITLAYCWAHARRKLFDVHKANGSEIAEEGLKQIAALYQIETDVRGQSPGQRLAVRKAKSAPRVEDFKQWLETQLARVSGKSPLGNALRYIDRHLAGLCLFLTDGRIEMDTNSVERTIRPITLNRKNCLFAGHEEGAKNWAMIASLIETCKLNGVNPQAWLAHTLNELAQQGKDADIKAMLPWNFTNESPPKPA